MKMVNRRSGAGLALLGLVYCTVVACSGDDKPGSHVGEAGDSNGSGASSSTGANGTGGSLIITTGGENASTGGESTGTGGEGCGSTRVAADPPVINVLMVVDKSLSMDDKPQGFAKTKWESLKSAVSATFKETAGKISFGLDLYPYSGTSGEALDDSCQMPAGAAVVVPVQPGITAGPLILAELEANPPSGATPTAAALARADAYFTTGAGKGLKGEKYVLLATDGGPNCNSKLTCAIDTCTVNMDGKACGPPGTNCCDPKVDKLGASNCLDDTASVAAVAALAKHGIKTFVIGIPGTEAYADTLDALAAKSGVTNPNAPPAYFAVSTESGANGLGEVLTSITTGLVTSCKLQLEEVPPVRNDVYVVAGDVELKLNDADGWIYDDSVSPPAIVIQGKGCDLVEAGVPFINVSYGCPNFEPPK